MKILANLMLGFAVVVSIVAMWLSLYPGVIRDILFYAVFTSVLWVPLAAVLGVVFLFLFLKRKPRIVALPVKQLGVSVAILSCTFILLLFYVPRRVAFLASRGEFEQLVAEAPADEYDVIPLNRHVAIFLVEDYAVDRRGGVYFRVYKGKDGIGPDVMSYGFVNHPNQEGTPFGAAHYRLFRIGYDWYWFMASDDFF